MVWAERSNACSAGRISASEQSKRLHGTSALIALRSSTKDSPEAHGWGISGSHRRRSAPCVAENQVNLQRISWEFCLDLLAPMRNQAERIRVSGRAQCLPDCLDRGIVGENGGCPWDTSGSREHCLARIQTGRVGWQVQQLHTPSFERGRSTVCSHDAVRQFSRDHL